MEIVTATAVENTVDSNDNVLAELESLTDVELAMIGGGQGMFALD